MSQEPTKLSEDQPAVKRGRRQTNKPNHHWTEEEEDIVRRDYRGDRASLREIGGRIGVTEYAVKGIVTNLGCAKITDRKPWSPEEEARLAELVQKYCPRRVAHMMHRSINSVVVKGKRLKLKRRHRDGWYVKREVCDILGVDHKWVQHQIDRGWLIATYHTGHRPQKAGMACWHIKEEDLAVFIRQHANMLNGRNVDLPQIVWLVRIRKEKGGEG